MGLSEQWVAVRVTTQQVAETASDELSELGLRVLSEHDGWLWAHGWPEQCSLDDLVTRVAGRFREPAIGAWVFDSDFGYIVGAADHGPVAFRLAVNPAYDEGDDDVDAEDLRQLWSDAGRRREGADGLAEWSARYAPRAVSATDVLATMPVDEAAASPNHNDAWSESDDGTQMWVFAEDGIRLLFDRLGFPNLDDTVFRPAGEATAESLDRLHIMAPDDSLLSLYARLHPRFGQRIFVSGDMHIDPAAFPDKHPSASPEWLDDVIAEISAWLRETGVEQVRVVLLTTDPTLSVWTIRNPLL
jgi:hypothetical protein